MPDTELQTLLEARGVRKLFPVGRNLLGGKPKAWVKAVDGVDLTVKRGSAFGLVGESGSGKTTLARLILRSIRPTEGQILFQGADVQSLRGESLKKYKSAVQVVFQDPYASLNPRMRISEIVEEPLIATGTLGAKARLDRVRESLRMMGLSEASLVLYPHQFSGGQRQRIAIARAIAPSPSFVVLDEPVSSLDVSIRAQIMNLLKDLQQQLGLTLLVISHDLAGVRYLSDTVGVMYLGRIVELGSATQVYSEPRHPYTQALLSDALPSHPRQTKEEAVLEDEIPSPLNIPTGCRFHPRCPHAMPKCAETEPIPIEVGSGHRVACFLYEE